MVGITHRDIKDENILINKEGKITLIDFGSGPFIHELESTKFEGTLLYSPPEWIKGQQYLFKEAAVWSLGILLYDILHGDIPFQTEEDIIKWDNKKLALKKHLSVDSLSLIKSCLHVNPGDRIKLEDIPNHSWLKDATSDINSRRKLDKNSYESCKSDYECDSFSGETFWVKK